MMVRPQWDGGLIRGWRRFLEDNGIQAYFGQPRAVSEYDKAYDIITIIHSSESDISDVEADDLLKTFFNQLNRKLTEAIGRDGGSQKIILRTQPTLYHEFDFCTGIEHLKVRFRFHFVDADAKPREDWVPGHQSGLTATPAS